MHACWHLATSRGQTTTWRKAGLPLPLPHKAERLVGARQILLKASWLLRPERCRLQTSRMISKTSNPCSRGSLLQRCGSVLFFTEACLATRSHQVHRSGLFVHCCTLVSSSRHTSVNSHSHRANCGRNPHSCHRFWALALLRACQASKLATVPRLNRLWWSTIPVTATSSIRNQQKT